MTVSQFITMFLVGIAIIAVAVFVIIFAMNSAMNLSEVVVNAVIGIAKITGCAILIILSFIIMLISWIMFGIGTLIAYGYNKLRKDKE